MVVRPLFPRAFVGSVVMRGGVQRWGLIGFAGSGETGDRSRFPLATRSLVRTADPTDRGLIVGSAVRTERYWPKL
jgi:hypothetical protein